MCAENDVVGEIQFEGKSHVERSTRPSCSRMTGETHPCRLAAQNRINIEVQRCSAKAGKLDPRIANALGYLGASYLRALEVSDIEKRLDALETNQLAAERGILQSIPPDGEPVGGG
jgi:hypothetical protein